MRPCRIIDLGEVSARLFALGLDTIEIAGALEEREVTIVAALESSAAHTAPAQTGSAQQ